MEFFESTLRELEVREKAFKSLENYYLKELCPNFKERFKSFEIQDIDSYENYNLQNIMDDLRHIQVLLQGSPSKTSFKQKREFLAAVGKEMLLQIKQRAGMKTNPALSTKKLVPVTTHEVKLPPLNTKLGYNSSSSQKTPKRAEEVKLNTGAPKTPGKAEAVKSDALKKQVPPVPDKVHKTISLPEISEETAGEDGMHVRPHSTDKKDTGAFIDAMVLTADQDEMLQRTLKKHGLKAEVWTNYLEAKLNSYSNFHHDYLKKNTSQLDLHIEIAKFEQEYERYVLRKNRTLRSIPYGSSQILNNGIGSMSFRARSQIDDSRLTESGTYYHLPTRQELDLEGKVGLRHEFLHMTPKKRFMSFKSIPLSQTPQKGELSPTMPTMNDVTESSHGRSRREMQSLDLTNSSSSRRIRVAPVMAVDLSPIKAQQEADSSTSDLNNRRNLKKLLTLNSKDLGTLKKSHLISSIISRKDLEGDVELKKTLKVSNVNTVNTISSAAISSGAVHRMDSCCTINDVSVMQPTQLGSRRMRKIGNENHVSPWEENSIKSMNTKTMMTVASQDTCFKISQIKSPTSEIKVSDILDLEYASNVRRIHLLGAGSEAKVFLCQIKEFEDIVALKQYELVKDKQNSFQSYESLKKEFNMLRQLNHDNIIKYLSLYKPRKMAYSNCIEFGIIMEYLSGGSLETYIDEKFAEISFKGKKSLMKQILLGIDYLHQNGIIHRDLKPGNILLSEDKTNVRITDFGISIKTNNDTSAKRTWVGTPWYMAPEVINQETYSSKADIWSAGCCFVHLLTGKKPYNNANAIQALMLMVNNRSPLETVDKKVLEDLYQQQVGVKELLESCFIRDKNDRPTAAQLLKLPLFTDI